MEAQNGDGIEPSVRRKKRFGESELAQRNGFQIHKIGAQTHPQWANRLWIRYFERSEALETPKTTVFICENMIFSQKLM
jgi:hypothetical protein